MFSPILGELPALAPLFALPFLLKRFSDRWIRSYEPGVSYTIFRGLDGATQSEETKLTIVSLEADAGDEVEFGVTRERDVVEEDFDLVDDIIIAAGDYTFDRIFVGYEGAGTRRIALEAEVSAGDFYDGELVTVSAEVDWRPSPHYQFSLGYEINEGDMPDGSFSARLITARANFAFNSRWSWTNFIQYDNVSESAGLNSRLRWNPRAGQDMYIVLNQGYERDDRDRFRSTATEVTGKVGYTFRF